jgi:hypothetical protein
MRFLRKAPPLAEEASPVPGEASPTAGATALLLALLVAVLYGRHLGEGLLADDFLYARWARQGWDVLLRHVTVASTPQMIRPLPGLLWELTRSPVGPFVLHLLSLLLHWGNGVLLAAFLRRRGVGGQAALAVAALFLAFPLLTEPVIWASASFDLWACLFALAALSVVAAGEGGAAPGAGLFLLALFCKESVLPLPFLLPLLLPWRQARRPALAMLLVAGGYLVFRFALFHGPGGYLEDNGSSLLFSLKVLPTLRSIFLRTPLRLFVPLKRAGALTPLCALLSALLLGAVLAPWLRELRELRERGDRALGAPLRAAAAFGLTILPVLPIFSLGIDQEGSRMIYFPAAIGLAACGLGMSRLPRLPPASRFALAGLLLYWSAATLWNGRAWTAAAAEVARARAALAELAPRLPPRSQVAVAGHDSWQGAFAWRNGLTAAAEVDGLPGGHLWTLGTAAVVEDPGPWLGRSLFEVGLGPRGELRDRTACARALLMASGAAPSLASWPVAAAPDPGGDPVTEVVLPLASLITPAGDLAVRLQLGSCRPRTAVSGALFWLFSDSRKFEATDSLPFAVGPRTPPEVVIHLFSPRLPEKTRPHERITLLLDLPRELTRCVVGARVVAVPAICRQ